MWGNVNGVKPSTNLAENIGFEPMDPFGSGL